MACFEGASHSSDQKTFTQQDIGLPQNSSKLSITPALVKQPGEKFPRLSMAAQVKNMQGCILKERLREERLLEVPLQGGKKAIVRLVLLQIEF